MTGMKHQEGMSRVARRIRNTGPIRRRVDSKAVAEALGAEKVETGVDARHGPVSLFALRRFLVNRLRSSGGRPALTGTTGRRSKIALLAGDWEKLEKIAKYYKAKESINVTPGQIASALIHTHVSGIDVSRLASLLKD